jgi:hypothetical protein
MGKDRSVLSQWGACLLGLGQLISGWYGWFGRSDWQKCCWAHLRLGLHFLPNTSLTLMTKLRMADNVTSCMARFLYSHVVPFGGSFTLEWNSYTRLILFWELCYQWIGERATHCICRGHVVQCTSFKRKHILVPVVQKMWYNWSWVCTFVGCFSGLVVYLHCLLRQIFVSWLLQQLTRRIATRHATYMASYALLSCQSLAVFIKMRLSSDFETVIPFWGDKFFPAKA